MNGKTFILSQQKEESFQNYLGSIKKALKNTTDRLLGLYSLKLAFPLVYSRFANSRFGTRILAKIKPKMNRFHPLVANFVWFLKGGAFQIYLNLQYTRNEDLKSIDLISERNWARSIQELVKS